VSERPDRVAIATRHTTIELPWGSRDKLLHEIRHLDGAEAIRAAFAAVGASRPLPLSRDDQAVLYDAIDAWANSVTIEELPEGVWALRNALADELHGEPDSAA
jgi:hypothetical protein